MKNSARRKLLAYLQNTDTIPLKAQAAHAVLVCASGDIVNIYKFDNIPYFFDLGDGNLYPTVYYVWISTSSYPTLLVPEQVFSFLENGADLMLPGVIHRPGSFPDFEKHSPVTISILTKEGSIKGPVATGASLLSSMEMIASGMQGRGVKILHLYKDYLWEFGPRLHPPIVTMEGQINTSLTEEDFPPLGRLSVNENKTAMSSSSAGNAEEDDTQLRPAQLHAEERDKWQDEESEDSNDTESPEDLLFRCFLAALKFRVSKSDLPLDVGEFYLNHLLPCVPSGKRIVMKKTKYKKFTVFLKEINSLEHTPVIIIDEKKKGAETITEIIHSHPLLRNFERKDEVTEVERFTAKPQTKVEEFYALTEPVMSLFRSVARLAKGDLLSAQDARQLITSYVKMKELNEKNGRVSLNDAILSSFITSSEQTIKWDVLMQKVLSRMTKTFVITTVDGTVLKYKLKLPEITFRVETRSGNKKVTLLNNAAAFGIQAKSLCQKIQVSLATSASVVNEAPQCEGPQIIVQGNQVRPISKILMEEFGIDKKFISGLDLAPKKKK